MTRVAKSLEKLRLQLNALFPHRSKVSDGGIGDARHRKAKSDHNPNSAGVVTARDFTFDKDPSDGVGIDCRALLNTLLTFKDKRIKYIIFERKIYNVKDGFKPRAYNGANAHDKHLHLSVSADPKLYDDGREWNLNFEFAHPVTVNVASSFENYAVQSGDTANKIAAEFGVKLEQLKMWNKLDDKYTVRLGQILRIK